MGHAQSLAYQQWPQVDEKLLIEDQVSLVIQVNGKKRALIEIKADSSEAQIKSAVIQQMSATDYKVSDSLL